MQTPRETAWGERAPDIVCRDLSGQITQRRIRPLCTVFLDREVRFPAFCRLRQDFRRLKVQQMGRVSLTGESLRPRRVPLLRAFIDRQRTRGAAPPRA